MKTFTSTDVLSWRPCHDEATVRRLAKGMPRRVTALDVLRAQHISAEDRLWVCLRKEVLSDKTLRLFAVSCTRRAFTSERATEREPDPRRWAACDVAERFACGEASRDELRAAGGTAWDDWAAGAPEKGARTEARAAARNAAGAPEREWQVGELLRLINLHEGEGGE